MLHYYDGQIKRYLTQLIRMFSNFTVRDGQGNIRRVPVTYGDINRQVAEIVAGNTENSIIAMPRMSLYITALEIDRDRTSDSTFVSKVHVRELAYDNQNEEYLNTQGKNFTVERLMPTPYKLSVNLDIVSSNTDQKLQIIEQIGMLFNPSLDLQTNDNFIDWSSLTTVELTNINFSSRTIPAGTESELDIATMGFMTPIYISPPAKVKRLGVITNIITSIFDEASGSIELGVSIPQLAPTTDVDITDTRFVDQVTVDRGEFANTQNGQMDINVRRDIRYSRAPNGLSFSTTWKNLGVYVEGNVAQLIEGEDVGTILWKTLFEVVPGCYESGLSQLRLRNEDNTIIVGTFEINPSNGYELLITWDPDTLPSNSVFLSPGNIRPSETTIDYIIDPLRWNPNQDKQPGLRVLLLGKIGSEDNSDGADAWKNSNGTDFVANENDIVEWSGTQWNIVFDSTSSSEIVYVSNLTTGSQYRWTGEYWTKSYEGEYSTGAWYIMPIG